MRNLKKCLALLLALLMMLSCTAVFADAVEEEQADQVLVTINGEALMQSEVESFFNYLVSYFANYGYDMSGEDDQLYLRNLALENLISQRLIQQKAHEMGLDVLTDEEMATLVEENEALWENAIQSYIDYYEPLAADATDADKNAARLDAIAYYESQGFTTESTLQDSIDALISERVQAEMVKDAAVTEEDIQALFDEYVQYDQDYYENNIEAYEYMTTYYGQKSYYVPEGYRGVTHILLQVDDDLLATYQDLQARWEEQQNDAEAAEGEEAAETDEEPVTAEQVEEARAAVFASVQATIDEIIEKFNAGTPFEELIAEYGTDPGMESEEYLKNGYAVHASSILWDPVFTAAAMSIPEVGGISEPALGSYGIHIVYYLRDIPGGAVELTDDIRAQLETELLSTKEEELYNLTLQEWRDSADIVYSELAQTDYTYPTEDSAEAEDAE